MKDSYTRLQRRVHSGKFVSELEIGFRESQSNAVCSDSKHCAHGKQPELEKMETKVILKRSTGQIFSWLSPMEGGFPDFPTRKEPIFWL